MLPKRRKSIKRVNPDTLFITVNPVGSKFAKALQQAIKTKVDHPVLRIRHPKPGRKNFIVTQQVLNKVEQFERFSKANVHCPRYALAEQAARNINCTTLFARTLVNATNGRGIIEFATSDVQYPPAPLYTEYIPKKSEYRVHVFNGEVIDTQQKKKKRGFEDERNTRVRNVDNGYVYCRDGIDPPDGLAALAINAVNACRYKYGAVDIIYNEKRNQCFVLEVNSRPGIINTTLDRYSEAIIKAYDLQRKQ